MKTMQTLQGKVMPQPLVKFITAVLTILKNTLSMENALTGIQFYGDMDD